MTWYEEQRTGLSGELELSLDAAFSLIQKSPLGFQIRYGNSSADSGASCYGAGMYFSYCQVSISNTRIDSNSSGSEGTWYYGGGIYFSHCEVSLVNTSVSSNKMGSGGSWNFGGGIFFEYSNVVMINCIIQSNVTGNGNGSGYQKGGGIYFLGTSGTLVNVLISNNTLNSGGQLYYGGGGIYAGFASDINLINVSIVGNHRWDEGPIQGPGLSLDSGSEADLMNSILWNVNEKAEISSGGSIDCDYSDVRTGSSGTGNISQDPNFVSENDFHLLPSSACLGAGTLNNAPTFDLDNMPRPLPAGTNPDMGCYEMDIALTANLPNAVNDLMIYPNPVYSNFSVHLNIISEKAKDGEVMICDPCGRIVLIHKIGNVTEISIDATSLVKGFYVCEVSDALGRILAKKKLIKN